MAFHKSKPSWYNLDPFQEKFLYHGAQEADERQPVQGVWAWIF
jgi:hypothetical protein